MQKKYCSIPSDNFSVCDPGNTFLFQIKVFDVKINGTTLTIDMIKITACSIALLDHESLHK